MYPIGYDQIYACGLRKIMYFLTINQWTFDMLTNYNTFDNCWQHNSGLTLYIQIWPYFLGRNLANLNFTLAYILCLELYLLATKLCFHCHKFFLPIMVQKLSVFMKHHNYLVRLSYM